MPVVGLSCCEGETGSYSHGSNFSTDFAPGESLRSWKGQEIFLENPQTGCDTHTHTDLVFVGYLGVTLSARKAARLVSI